MVSLVPDHSLDLGMLIFNLVQVLVHSIDVLVDHRFQLIDFDSLGRSILLQERFIIFNLHAHFI